MHGYRPIKGNGVSIKKGFQLGQSVIMSKPCG